MVPFTCVIIIVSAAIFEQCILKETCCRINFTFIECPFLKFITNRSLECWLKCACSRHSIVIAVSVKCNDICLDKWIVSSTIYKSSKVVVNSEELIACFLTIVEVNIWNWIIIDVIVCKFVISVSVVIEVSIIVTIKF